MATTVSIPSSSSSDRALPPQQWRQQQQQQDRPIAMAQHATMEQRTPTVKPVNVATNVALTQTRGHVEGENMDENDESEDSAPEGMDADITEGCAPSLQQ